MWEYYHPAFESAEKVSLFVTLSEAKNLSVDREKKQLDCSSPRRSSE
jgi:hypothetical protein